MASEEFRNSYDDIRLRNIERNNDMLRSLGLSVLSTSAVQEQAKSRRKKHTEGSHLICKSSPRRSAGLAGNGVLTLNNAKDSIRNQVHRLTGNYKGSAPETEELHNNINDNLRTTFPQEESQKMENQEYEKAVQEFSTSNSSGSMFHEDLNDEGHSGKKIMSSRLLSEECSDEMEAKATMMCLNSLKTMTPATFGSHFQELVIQALVQSTKGVIGSSSNIQSSQGTLLSSSGVIPKLENSVPNTWKEPAYNKFEAQRQKRPLMTRTSTGEGTDSQEDFPIPENESPHERSIRTRRLNRSRARKAKELTSNRKAMKKLPYVIHVDGTCRAKGIHKHLWRAAVRGQCGRLDPSMDNINHHAKHVVDGIWHALEKEWEFEGFAHRAREMFERSATKFMRNRKMQLKKRAKKNMQELNPADVSPNNWKKIVQLSKDSPKQSTPKASIQSTVNRGPSTPKVLHEHNEVVPHFQGAEQESHSRISKQMSMDVLKFTGDEKDVDERIQSLRNELMKLENTKKNKNYNADASVKGKALWEEIEGCGDKVDGDEDGKKENVYPREGKRSDPPVTKETALVGTGHSDLDVKAYGTAMTVKSSVEVLRRSTTSEERAQYLEGGEMECGDLVSLLAVEAGEKKEIGKAIVMALSGSKYVRKVIPKGWRLVKVYTYTVDGASEVCPFPAAWADQVKYKTLKAAEGRNIIWPDDLLRP